jgi:arylsulfatase
LKSLVAEPPIKTGTPDPYTPPRPDQVRPEQHVQLGPVIQEITEILVTDGGGTGAPHHGIPHVTG